MPHCRAGRFYHAAKALSDPITRYGPRDELRKPTRYVSLGNVRVLLRNDEAYGTADVLGQRPIFLAAFIEAPRIAPAGNH